MMGKAKNTLNGSAQVHTAQGASESPAEMAPVYAIRVKGHLDPRWELFHDLTLTAEPDGATLLTGQILDQSALHSVLDQVLRLGLQLLAVNRISITPAGNTDCGEDRTRSDKE